MSKPYSFSVERYAEVMKFLKTLPKEVSILDIGCGTGNILEEIVRETGIRNVVGVDIDEDALEIARSRGLKVLKCSIINDCIEKINEKFNVVIVGAVLHHIVAETRTGSINLAKRSLSNAIHLLKCGGYLIILEPTFEPFWLLTVVFYLKRFVSHFTPERVTIFNYWNNIGAPVVSYLSSRKLESILKSFSNLLVVKIVSKKVNLNFIQKLFFLRKFEVTIIVKKSY